jgi:DNA-binding winged helix-turn-helix (wHTH) protein/Tol biopolymer transport system component
MKDGQFYEFGPFRLDASERVLLRDGKPLPLPPKDIETLIVLVEKHGHIVEKDELLQKVWPGVFVEEGNLARRVSNLRNLLTEGSDGRAFIETVPTRGYRFVAPVECLADPGDVSERAEPVAFPMPKSSARLSAVVRHPATLAGVVLALLTAAGLGMYDLVRPQPTAKVLAASQITHLGNVAGGLASDGSRIYFSQAFGAARALFQVPISGGEALPIPTSIPDPVVHDFSLRRGEILVGTNNPHAEESWLWAMPAGGGAARRIGDLSAQDAAWSPDGQRIVLTHGPDLVIAAADGSAARTITTLSGTLRWPRWSPEKALIRFTREDAAGAYSMWEVAADGSGLRQLFSEWSQPEDRWGSGPSSGGWTPDGKCFLFRSHRDDTFTLWAECKRRHFWGEGWSKPVQLYSSAAPFWPPVFSSDERNVYLVVQQDDNRELVRYDPKLRQFVPHLSGLPVRSIRYSPDGRWICYTTPNAPPAFRRMRADGRELLELAAQPSAVFFPAWSPDSRRIAVNGAVGVEARIYVVSRDGGAGRAVTPGSESNASWFPDGRSLLFLHVASSRGDGADPTGIYKMNLETQQMTQLPGSEPFHDPSLSPDGNFVAAVSADLRQVWLFEFRTKKWNRVATGQFIRPPFWTHDSRLVYFQDGYSGAEQPIYSVSATGGPVRMVASARQLMRADAKAGFVFVGLTPDDAPLASVLRYSSNVHALRLDLP